MEVVGGGGGTGVKLSSGISRIWAEKLNACRVSSEKAMREWESFPPTGNVPANMFESAIHPVLLGIVVETVGTEYERSENRSAFSEIRNCRLSASAIAPGL